MLSAAIAVAGLTYIWAANHGLRPLVYVLKPGTMLLIIALAIRHLPASPHPGYPRAIVAGLVFSMAGDVFLMLPLDRFVSGLASFLLAHLCYIWAIWTAAPARLTAVDAGLGVVLVAVALPVLRRFLAGVREGGRVGLAAPVVLYAVVISVMVWRATATLFYPGLLPLRRELAAAGALLFFVSDAVLAWDRFVEPLRARHWVIMGTYFAAQYCFAATVAWPPG